MQSGCGQVHFGLFCGSGPGPYSLEITIDTSEQFFPAVKSFVGLHPIIFSYILKDFVICFLFSLIVHTLQTTVGSCYIVLSLPAPHNSLQARANARSEQKAHSRLKCVCPQSILLMSTLPAPTSLSFFLTPGKRCPG